MNQQLSLRLDPATQVTGGALPTRVPFAIPALGGPPFDDDERYFEPWWPGGMAHLRLQGGNLELQTEHLADPLVTFPELATMADHIAGDGVFMAGTLLALDGAGRPDAGLLRKRLSGTLTEPAEGAFVASDLLYCEGQSLARRPFSERRRQLAALVTDSEHFVVGRGLARDGTMLARAVSALGLDAISARRLDGRWRPGSSTDAWLKLLVTEQPQRPTRPFLVLLEKLPLEGQA
jgi:bifunctional non-homologous end joining protein LigD